MSGATAVIGPIQGGKGADIVPPLASIKRANSPGGAKQRTRSGVTGRTGGSSARGASRTVWARCPRRLKLSRPISQSAPGG